MNEYIHSYTCTYTYIYVHIYDKKIFDNRFICFFDSVQTLIDMYNKIY